MKPHRAILVYILSTFLLSVGSDFSSLAATADQLAPLVTIQSFPVGAGPSGLAFDGANIWTANISSNNVTKLRASDGTLLGNASATHR